jgi:hypothetical protein
MEHALNETDKAITFTLSNQIGTISIKANGANEDDALANLVEMLKNTVDSLGIDAEVFNY